MAHMKPGTRLKSVVCNGEAMVVKAPEGDLVLTCGGMPMSTEAEINLDPSQANAEHMYECLIGKRYVNEEETIAVSYTHLTLPTNREV
mgnify:CR=1 FL=1